MLSAQCALHTFNTVLVYLECPEARRKALEGRQKAIQGSETETRELLGGTEENSVSPMRGH